MVQRGSAIPPKADPWQRLTAAMLLQAVKDLKQGSLITQLDCVCWILDGEAEYYLTSLDMLPDGDILERMVTANAQT